MKRRRSYAHDGVRTSEDFTSGSVASSDGRRASDSALRLPVRAAKGAILHAVKTNDVVIVVGETGSGKTTQIPQIILDESSLLSSDKLIAVTQPRRVATISVATRVALERRELLGTTVSYAVRFDDCTTDTTRLRYLTDGVLLREALNDVDLSNYALIVVDEVHERSVNTDILCGICKRAAERRRGSLKLVVMSATADTDRLRDYFEDGLKVAVVEVPGRMYSVRVFNTAEPVEDYVDAAINASIQLHLTEELPGDILVFLTGQEEIDSAVSIVTERFQRLPESEAAKIPKLVARPLYAALPPEEQLLAINPLPKHQRGHIRKVLFATNVAETSVTIRGVKYVIDSGVSKSRSVGARTNADVLKVGPISKAQALQRGGRAGREAEGKCFRLYTEQDFANLAQFPKPEILRCDLAAVVLQLISMKLEVLSFDFIDTPPRRAISNALELLLALGAVDENMRLTKLGSRMGALPLPPMLACAVLEARNYNCMTELIALAAMLSIESPYITAKSQLLTSEIVRRRFASAIGDHIGLLNALLQYTNVSKEQRSKFCRDHLLNPRSMSAAENIRAQLDVLLARDKGHSGEGDRDARAERFSGSNDAHADTLEKVRKCVVAGYFRNAARLREDDGKYVGFGSSAVGGGGGAKELDIHPSSALRQRKTRPSTIVYHELVVTTRTYARIVVEIERQWLLQHARGYYQTVDGDIKR